MKIKVTINANTPTCTNLQIDNKLNISATNEPATVLGNNPSNATFVMQCIDLRSKKVVDKPTVTSGDTVTYSVTYGNSGNTLAMTGQIVDVLPAGMTYVANSTTSVPNIGQPTVGTSGGLQTLTWNVSNLTA